MCIRDSGNYEQEADDGLIQCDSNMEEDAFIQHHAPEAQCNLRRTAEDKRIYDSYVRGEFPDKKKT